MFLKKGENNYINTFRRLAGRYLEIDTKEVDIKCLRIRPVVYPNKRKKVKYIDETIKDIYETCAYTLECCMHEHYEDCPWREQALYALDSRNQMLCGYYTFRDTVFQRENILLLAKSLRKDGLLSICAPSGLDLPIPSFSLVYPMQVYEYVKHTGDSSIIKKVGPVLRAIKRTFERKIDKNFLIPAFGNGCWNFYEWSHGSSNEAETYEKINGRYDLILNCAYVNACKYFDILLEEKTDLEQIKKAIKSTFYNTEKGLYKLDNKTDNYSVLGNAFALLIGLGDKEFADKIIHEKSLISITLSMKCFLYDALLACDKAYMEYIVQDINESYNYMLSKGATTFWETIKGADDFDGAGSLCHGWSALPIYYYNLFNLVETED